MPAVLTYLRFLTLELGTPRSADAAQQTMSLLSLGVQQESEKNISITLNPDAPRDEGDFQAAEFLLSLAVAAGHTEEGSRKSETERGYDVLQDFLSMLDESKDAELRQTWVWQHAVELLLQLKSDQQLEAFSYVVQGQAGRDGAKLWVQQHPEQVQALLAWLKRSFTQP